MNKMSLAKLTVHIKNKKPIELCDFTNSFQSLANQYNLFLTEHDEFDLTDDAKLYIKEIKSGCIITELSDLLPIAIPFIEHSNSIIEFTSFIKSSMMYFLGKIQEKPKDFTLKDCANFDNIIKPIAKDNGSNVIYTGEVKNENITINFNFNSVEANAIQNGISREKEKLKEPEETPSINVLFYWDTAQYDKDSKRIDKGSIDSICGSPLKVTFNDNSIKTQMLDIDDNPFHKAYLVDVEVLKIQGIPKVYKIRKLHDTLPK